MLTIKVWCLPRLSQKKLEGLFWDIVEAVGSVKAMTKAGHTGTGNMLVLYPSDKMKLGLGAEVLIEVEGLTDARICNLSVRNELAGRLGLVVEKLLPKAQIDCRIHKPDSSMGRWQNTRRKMPVEKRPR
jgi:hypothetical protein